MKMNVNDETYLKINNLFWNWLSINDLDEYAISSPERAAAFGFYVAKNSDIKDIDIWDTREFIQLQLDSLELLGSRL